MIGYVLPIRRRHVAGDVPGLAAYLAWLSRRAEAVVVDASPPEVFAAHAAAWGRTCRHLCPHPELSFANGKVNGVLTGVREVGHERVVLADDDVRYDDASLRRVTELLDRGEVVRPQNYFSPLPWHALWDTARSLLNRALGSDYPGTLAVRRSFLLGIGGYDGDVLFENLELIRTVEAAGGRVVEAPGVYVRRLPPSAGHFWSQRVRQAYDDLAQPLRLGLFLGILPGIAAVPWLAPILSAGAAGLAEVGRRRAGGAAVFPASAVPFAPAWLLERAVCSWLAVGIRLAHGGVRYHGTAIRRAASSPRALRGRGLVRSVAEGRQPGAAAAAERDGAAAGADLGTVLVDEAERAPDEEGTVLEDGDLGRLGAHRRSRTSTRPPRTRVS